MILVNSIHAECYVYELSNVYCSSRVIDERFSRIQIKNKASKELIEEIRKYYQDIFTEVNSNKVFTYFRVNASIKNAADIVALIGTYIYRNHDVEMLRKFVQGILSPQQVPKS